PLPPGDPGLTAQVIGTGPTVYNSAMPEVFETLLYTARRELVITTPYYVPDEAMQAALCASGRRGVRTIIIFPARNDSWIVAAASRSYYSDLLAAGVRIYEYEGGLLHTKSLTLDGEVTLIGSANMDRRRSDFKCRTAPSSGRLSRLLLSCHSRHGSGMADDPPALEQHHCDAGANFVR